MENTNRRTRPRFISERSKQGLLDVIRLARAEIIARQQAETHQFMDPDNFEDVHKLPGCRLVEEATGKGVEVGVNRDGAQTLAPYFVLRCQTCNVRSGRYTRLGV